jgi:prepilin signal peptidase PulO-like enzyme (type II secretory pathway)
VWFSAEVVALTVAQASCIALAGAGLPRWASRFRARAWALVLPLSIAVVVGAIALIPSTADLLTWVALILVPIGCALALGWAMRGARPSLAALAVPLLALAWALPDDRLGELATVVLIAGSAITAGRLLAGAAPLSLLKAGVILMAVVDAALVFSGNLQHPNEVLVAAAPGGGLPQLQSASYAGAGMGYGDFFAAAVVGAILAAERRPQLGFAAFMVGAALCWDQLFLVYDVLPATVPPALTLIAAEVWSRRRARSAALAPSSPVLSG